MVANKTPEQPERRRYLRICVPVKCRSSKKEESPLPAQNLSFGGVRIYSNKYLETGKQIDVDLLLPNDQRITATARVAWIKVLPAGSDAVFDVALEFVDLSPDATDKLQALLESSFCGD